MIKLLCQDIWDAQQKFRALGADFGCRMTVIKHAQGVILYSPITLTSALLQSVKTIGDVTHIIAPNSFHHLFIEPWCESFPKAQILSTRRVQKLHPKLKITTIFDETTNISLPEQLDFALLTGRLGNSELVLFHRPSGSIIVGDLLFNPTARSSFDKFTFGLFGITKRPSPSRLFRFFYRKLVVNLPAINKIKHWPVKQIIVAHGKIITDDAAQILSEGCDRL